MRQTLSDKVWFCLSPASQQDLGLAIAHLTAPSEANLDQSAAVTGLATVLERELLQPLLLDFAQYGTQTGDPDLIALAHALTQETGLAVLAPLLSETWKTLSPRSLTAAKKPTKGLYQTLSADTADTTGGPFPIDDTHRVMLDEFLQGWDHPIARWLTQAGGEAASDLAQVAQLRLVATEGQAVPPWQGQMVQQLVLGHRQKRGILQKIFG